MKVISATFEKPAGYLTERFPDATWEFSVKTDIEFPHGHSGFGGLLRKIGGDAYQARNFGNTDWAELGVGRRAAIQNLLPLAFEAMKQWKQTQDAEEANRQARRNIASDLRNLLNTLRVDYAVQVGVNDWKLDEPIQFRIVIDNLHERDVYKIAKLLSPAEGS